VHEGIGGHQQGQAFPRSERELERNRKGKAAQIQVVNPIEGIALVCERQEESLTPQCFRPLGENGPRLCTILT
jgi:hypothetical protein